MFEVFAIQSLAWTVLFEPGTAVDQIFAFTGRAAQDYTTDRYFNSGVGQFQAKYFRSDLKHRGLLDSKSGPALKSFSFYEDAGVIHDAISQFMKTFVYSYYDSDSEVADDEEIQAWAAEANGPAEAIDFPDEISSRRRLSKILTHFVRHSVMSHDSTCTNFSPRHISLRQHIMP